MAEYGAELYDASGRRFGRVDGGQSYHYWGKVTISFSSMGNWHTVPLFNIPASVKISAFIFCDFGGNETYKSRYGKAEVRQSNGTWHARAMKSMADAEPSLTSVTIYVFVPARYITSLAYGMTCFDANSVKVYDSSRPLLQICGLGAGGAQFGTTTFFNRTPTKCASAYISTSAAFYITVNGVPYWAVTFYYGTTTTGQLKGFTGMISYLDQRGSAPPYVQISNVPLIDAGYYDQFANLGNM